MRRAVLFLPALAAALISARAEAAPVPEPEEDETPAPVVELKLKIKRAPAPENPFFGTARNQFSFNFGQGIDSGIIVPPPLRPIPFEMLHFQYSQPSTFFRLPARQNISVVQTVGLGRKYGWDWWKCSIPIAFLSEDVVLYSTESWYYGSGIGVGMQAQQNERISSKLLFGFKLLAGYRISEEYNLELFMQHFSNGNTATDNYSYAFYGVGLAYNF